MGAEKPPLAMSEQKDLSVHIRGMYFTNTITTQVFVPFTGIMGSFVINNVSPVDPKVQKIEGNFNPRQPISPTDYGGNKEDGEFVVDPSRPSNINPASLPPGGKTNGVFFAMGSTATGICKFFLDLKMNVPLFLRISDMYKYVNMHAYISYCTGVAGYIISKEGGKVGVEFYFYASAAKEIGTWNQKGESGCFMFNELGNIVAFDDSILTKRAEEEKRVPGQIKVFNFQVSRIMYG